LLSDESNALDAAPVLIGKADTVEGQPAGRRANAGHISLGQLKVMSAIKRCRTTALSGHSARWYSTIEQ
jgi:hypothetical protein